MLGGFSLGKSEDFHKDEDHISHEVDRVIPYDDIPILFEGIFDLFLCDLGYLGQRLGFHIGLELDGLTGQETSDCPGFDARLTSALLNLDFAALPPSAREFFAHTVSAQRFVAADDSTYAGVRDVVNTLGLTASTVR